MYSHRHIIRDNFLRIFLFYNTNSAIYSLFLIFMRFFIKQRETILLFALIFFCVFRPISLLLVLQLCTVAILNQMSIISVKNRSSDSNSPAGDVVNHLPLFQLPRRRFFRKSANRNNIFNLFFVKLGKKEAPFICLQLWSKTIKRR